MFPTKLRHSLKKEQFWMKSLTNGLKSLIKNFYTFDDKINAKITRDNFKVCPNFLFILC